MGIVTDSHLPWLRQQLDEWDASLLRRRRRVVTPLKEGWCLVDGRRVRNFAGNDYLHLAQHPDVIAAAQAAVVQAGVGSQGSALVCGRTSWHVELEQRLARFEGAEAAILFPTGMAANMGTITALAGARDVVFCDRLNHASLIDGCRLCGAKFRVYRHKDLNRLGDALQQAAHFQRRWIVTDSVFSMDGDLAPLPELCDLAERYQAHLIVDEAHATGVFGATGRGVCEHFGVARRVAVRVGTLSKALGALGGFVCGSAELIETLWNSARTQMFSTALPPAICAAATAALDVLEREPERRIQLQRSCELFRTELRQRGVEPLPGSTGPIVPVVTGSPATTLQVAAKLEERGYLVGAIRPPTVPAGTSRLRISLSLAHSTTEIAQFAAVLTEELSAL